MGIDFQYENGLSDRFHIVETIGGGLASLDYDLDGDQDLFLVQGGDPHATPAHPHGGRLYRNLYIESGELRFEDATAQSGMRARRYGLGVTVGDPNADGWPDIYLSNYGPNELWLNQGDGRFVESGAALGIDHPGMSTGALFADLDGDGDQDLFLASYVDGAEEPLACLGRDSARDYCSPRSWAPSANLLFNNEGDGFVNQGPLTTDHGSSFAVLPLDVNGDARVDLLVANDGMENRLWINQGGLRFADQAPALGLAVNMAGVAEASMGVDISDVDGDGALDIFMTHLRGESNTLYRRLSAGAFLDSGTGLGLAGTDLPYTGWGIRWLDYNRDTWPDLFLVNGAESIGNGARPQRLNDAFAQTNLAYRNFGGRLVPIADAMPPAWREPGNSRGLISADFDNDGSPDLAVLQAGDPFLLFRNQHAGGTWIGIEPRQSIGPWPLSGVRIGLRESTGTSAFSYPLGGFLSVSDPRIILPANGTAAVDIVIEWEDGARQRVSGLGTGRYHTVEADKR